MPPSPRPERQGGVRPNLFLIGAPRCGTTALHQYLSTHPAIFMSEPKELLFWADDFPRANEYSYARLRTLQDYLACFAAAQSHHRVIGESTATYLYSRRAVARLHEFAPDARFLVLLRDPLDLVHSWHGEMLYNYCEDVADFRTAWALQPARALGHHIPGGCFVPEFLQYEQIARLGDQVERLLAVVPREQVKFILYEDIALRTLETYRDVLRFLDLSDDGRTAFPRINQTKRVRFQRLGETLFHPPALLAPAVRAVRRAYARSPLQLKTALARLLRTQVVREPPSAGQRALLREIFRSDTRKLEGLIQRDLSFWLGPADPLPRTRSRAAG